MKKLELIDKLYRLPNKEKYVMVSIKPKLGMRYDINYNVTSVGFVRELDTLFITNAFSDVNPKMTVNQVLFNLYKDDGVQKDCDVKFEVYGLSATSGGRLVSTSPNIEDVEIVSPEDSAYIYIYILVEFIV